MPKISVILAGQPNIGEGRKVSTTVVLLRFFLPFWDWRPTQWLDRLAAFGVGDQCIEPFLPRFFLFCSDYPEGCRAPVPGRLGLEEVPGLAVGAEVALHFATEVGLVALFVGVLAGLVFGSFKCFDAGGAHSARVGEPLHLPYVHGAPLAFELARGEANGIGVSVDAPPDAIDPPEAQRLVHRLGIGDAGFGRLLAEADPEFLALMVLCLQPAPKHLGRSKKDDFHCPDFNRGRLAEAKPACPPPARK